MASTAPKMLLHWSPRSPFVRKVMVAAHELSLADRIELRRTVVRMDAPNVELAADNPLSKIPTLVLPGGEALVDSLVISLYLDDLAGGGLILPRAGEARSRELSRHAVLDGLMGLLVLWRAEREKPLDRQTEAWLASFARKTSWVLAWAAADVAPISPGPLQLSEIALGCMLSYLDFRFPDRDWRADHRALAAWHETFQVRPSALATQVVADG